MTHNNNLAKIHIARQQLGLDDSDYRGILKRVAGVTSARQLSDRQAEAVLGEFKRLGWQPRPAKKQGRARPRPALSRQNMINKIEALLAEAGRPWGYADATAERMFAIKRVEWLTDAQVKKLMQALIIDADRHGRLPCP